MEEFEGWDAIVDVGAEEVTVEDGEDVGYAGF